MSLVEQVRNDQVEARKARDSLKATLLTTLLGELGRDGSNVQVTDDKVIAAAKKFIKGIDESLGYMGESTPIAAELLKDEKAVLEAYLPRQMSKEQIKGAINTLFERGETMNKGNMMKRLKDKFAGQYDGKEAAAAVDELLG